MAEEYADRGPSRLRVDGPRRPLRCRAISPRLLQPVVRRLSVVAAALMTLGGLGGEAAAASPWDLFGADSRSIGLGGAVSALCSNGFAAYYNPAGLTLNPSATMSLGYMGSVALLDGELTDPGSLPSPDLVGASMVDAADVANSSFVGVAATLVPKRPV